MDFALVERTDYRPVDRHEQKLENFERFPNEHEPDVAHHFENIVCLALRFFGRFHLAEVLQVLLDFGGEVREDELVTRLLGKFR